MKKPLVSVLICTYNAEKTIKQALKTCLNQTYDNFEILIHDDKSKDKTIEVINSIWDKRIQIIDSWKKLWSYQWLNFLLDHAKWDYIAIQDHDDLWYPEKLEKQVKFLEENKKYVWCWTTNLMWYEWDEKWFEYFVWDECTFALHPSLMFRNNNYRYPNRDYMNDAYFQKKVLCNWEKLIANLKETLTIHRVKKWFDNYSYKWFKFTPENLNTIYYLHWVINWTNVIWFEIFRKIVYPILHWSHKDEWINNCERLPFTIQRKTIFSTKENHIIHDIN